MLFSTTNIDKTYNYDDFLKRNRIKYYLLVPAVVLLAAVVYLFFLYDPSPSINTNNGESMALDEPQQIGSPEIGATTVTDAAESKAMPVTLPSAQESSNETSSNEASSNEEKQPEVVASDEASSSESALSDQTASMESFVSAADDNTTEATTVEANEEPKEETTLAVAVDDSTQVSITTAAVDESMQETMTPAAAKESNEQSNEQSTEDSTEDITEDITAKRVTYVKTARFDSPQADSSAGDDSRVTLQVEEKQSHSVVADDQKQLSGRYIEHQAVITSSLSQATSDAGLSANQSARIGRIFEPYLDSRRELRKGDKLMIVIDPAAGKTGNDAEQVHRLEFHGASKHLVVTRKEGSLSDYEVRSADGEILSGKNSTNSIAVEKSQRETSVAVEKPRRETPVEPAPRSVVDNNASTGGMKRMEGVVATSLFSAAREAGLNAGQINKLEGILTPYINFNKEVRKGDRIVITLQGDEIYSSEFIGAVKKLTVTRVADDAYRVKLGETGSDAHNGEESSAKKPFWKRLGFGSSGGDENEDKKDDEKIVEKADVKVESKGDEESSAKKPFWKRWGFKDSTEEKTVLSNE